MNITTLPIEVIIVISAFVIGMIVIPIIAIIMGKDVDSIIHPDVE